MSAGSGAAAAPLLSVIVPTSNRPGPLGEALESIRSCAAANRDVTLELLVVNDGSPDGLVELTSGYGARLLDGPGRGPAAARNVGMSAARGAFLAFLDDDDAFLPGHIRTHLELLQARPDISAVFGQVQIANEKLTLAGPAYPPTVEEDPFHYLLANWHQIGSVVVRSEVRTTVGTFDERLATGEEQDWLLRLFLRHQVAFVPVPCLLYRQRPAGTADRYFAGQVRYARRNLWVHARRAGPRRPSWRRLARISIRHNGHFAGHLLGSAEIHASSGDSGAARYALRSALLTSPPHVAVALARRPALIRVFAGVLWSRRVSSDVS
jgi:glycosyltransferase involved in cell wall biosynthesis